MGYICKWIEGEKNLMDYCIKRFGEKPKFVETVGKVGEATAWYTYKLKEGHGYVAMYMLFMKHEKGEVCDLMEKFKMSYEEIRADKSSIVV